MQQPAQTARRPLLQGNGLGHRKRTTARKREQPGARLHATRKRQVNACSLCCMTMACNGAALRQGVVTGSTADSDDASSTTQRFVNALASAPVILRSDASKAGPVKPR